MRADFSLSEEAVRVKERWKGWNGASQVALVVRNPPSPAGDIKDQGLSLSQEDLLEKGMAPHSSILAWRIQWTEEPGRLQSHGQRSLAGCTELAKTEAT